MINLLRQAGTASSYLIPPGLEGNKGIVVVAARYSACFFIIHLDKIDFSLVSAWEYAIG
ncbi:MAG: hypothetical protein V3580_01905 [Candidatus Cardinium sp.]